MKTTYLLIPLLGIALMSCKKQEIDDLQGYLFTPALNLTEAENPYTGLLAVYPCQSDGSIYFGNYNKDKLSPIYANYVVASGSITQSNPPLSLPLGGYNLIYWGISKAIDVAYENPAAINPPLVLGADTKNLYFTLRKNSGDTTVSPSFDYVFNAAQTQVGNQSLSVPLRRVVAGLQITVKRSNNVALDPAIEKIEILVSDIAARLNLYDATASEFTQTVKFPLTIDESRMSATNNLVTLFPSVVMPRFAIVATLGNGKQKIYRTTLSNILSAGNSVKITVNMGEIITEETTGNGFTVSDWNEESETINTGPI